MSYRKLWIALALVLVISFAVLGGVGIKVMNNAPPIPSRVVTSDGRMVFDGATIMDGQNAWQSIGGQEVGTIWGHGSYIAPDWTADWLHRESVFILDGWASKLVGQIMPHWGRSRRQRYSPAYKPCFAPTRMTRQRNNHTRSDPRCRLRSAPLSLCRRISAMEETNTRCKPMRSAIQPNFGR